MYCAMIGELVDVKKHKDNHIEILRSIMDEINIEYKEEIISKFSFNEDSSFYIIMNKPDFLIFIIDKIKHALYPGKLRFGIGFGKISTVINKDVAFGTDGPAYNNAMLAIEEVKERQLGNSQPKVDTLVCIVKSVNTDYYWEDRLAIINGALAMQTLIEMQWTKKQQEIVNILLYNNINQSVIAENLNISQSSVMRRIQGADLYTYEYARKTIVQGIKTLWRDMS